ncbi:hypothetical protein P7L53_06940 [Thermoleptolyngbya sichuanensis XZ-Cy5]|nr:hypothetical protein [Thermoleptolyngbya sichuanensis]MDG2615979.1 hypothetical protein [Thermoleptolyngbya sichuanensis XZ-Cy5]
MKAEVKAIQPFWGDRPLPQRRPMQIEPGLQSWVAKLDCKD